MNTIIFLGSSVTFGSASGGYSMCNYLAEQTGCRMVKWAVSGTTLADLSPDSYVSRMKQAMRRESQCDLFVCQLSTNDAGQNLPLGEVSDSRHPDAFDTKTVTGAMEWIIAAAKEKWGCTVGFYTGTRFESEYYQHMVDTLMQLKDKWNLSVLNLWDDPQMNAVSPQDYARFMDDPIHPTLAGYREWWGPKFLAWISKI